MEALLNGSILMATVLLSFLLALWMAWMTLRGLFRLMPLTSAATIQHPALDSRPVARRQEAVRRSRAA
ncbi:MAG TPA: hypothetical protein VKT71_10975 [Candidatus Acidoferrales bacterium]|nr:hypothetical protein [Candidatus Acidoferrales bacterium]